MTKVRTPVDNPKSNLTPPLTSIKQRLQTDLERSVGVTTTTLLMWLNRFTSAQPSNLPHEPCNHKNTHLKIYK